MPHHHPAALALAVAWFPYAGGALAVTTTSLPPTLESAEHPGFYASPPGVDILRNAIRNPDGSRTIPAGKQTPEANALHQAACAALGGQDITNDGDVTLGSSTLDGMTCIRSTDDPLPFEMIGVVPTGVERQVFYPSRPPQPRPMTQLH